MSPPVVYLLSILVAAAPTILYRLIFWWLDRHEKEPKAFLAAAFIWGAVPAVLLSLFIEAWFSQPLSSFPEQVSRLLGSALIAPPVEEMAKAGALWGLFHWAHAEFDGVLDGILYGAMVGLGFGMVENVLYFVSAWRSGGITAWATIVPSRALVFGLNHAMFTAFTGLGYARARYETSPARRRQAVGLGLLAAVAVHLLHNALSGLGLCLIGLAIDWSGVLIILIIALLSWRREAEQLQAYLSEEVTLGVLSQPLYEAVTTRGMRYRAMWQRLRQQGAHQAQLFARLAHDAAELAQKKHQLARMGDEGGNLEAISQLRLRLRRRRTELGE